MNHIDSAIYYYRQCHKYIHKNNSNYYLLPDALLKLSEIYKKQNRQTIAYKFLHQSQATRDSLIQLQLSANSELFEIKDSYLNSLKEKDIYISLQEKEIKYQEQVKNRLIIILALALLLGGTAVLVIRMRLKLNRTLLEKKNNELESKLTEEKIKGEMEVKSKELTSYALQMIDKDTAIDELLEAIKNDAPGSYKPLQAKYQKGSKDLWDEFNLRFTEVNTAFYSRLNAKFPNLSSTEQKHCALIKLNFGTKEMARILNIAPHSVHISRSRIRKKMSLERSENLEKHIANL
ncbi:helix-turn-helix transcriptional regulator [Saccharicrinis sp. GN24d3]